MIMQLQLLMHESSSVLADAALRESINKGWKAERRPRPRQPFLSSSFKENSDRSQAGQHGNDEADRAQ